MMDEQEALHIDSGVLLAELIDRSQWVCWRTEERDGKPTKIPVDSQTGGYASATDGTTWSDVETALDYAASHSTVDGIGFVFTEDDSLVGVDLDDCRDPETGELTDEAQDIVDRLASYTEISPSGTGVHVILRGVLPEGRNRRGDIELYDQARYFTVTGNRIEETPTNVEERQDALVAIHREYLAQADSTGEPTAQTDLASVSAGAATSTVDLSDEELLEKAQSASNGEKFGRLWRGDTSGYDSHSEADIALCCLLAFWTGRDRSRVDRLFRESGLLREKWDETHYADGATYGERTVERALSVTSEAYDPETAPDESASSETTDDPASEPEASGRSKAYLIERNRLLRERVDRLETDLEQTTERAEILQGEVMSLQTTLTEREATIKRLTDHVEQDEATRSLWHRTKRALGRKDDVSDRDATR